jgi:predicted PurR-regulated permease PerM
MYYFYSFLISILIAFACSHFAKKKGRNSSLWFMSGAFFGVFALIVLLFLPKLKRTAAQQASSAPVKLLRALIPAQMSKFWYYLDEEKKQFGPMSFEALSRAWEEGEVQAHTLLWNEDLENWKRLDEVTSPFTSSTS